MDLFGSSPFINLSNARCEAGENTGTQGDFNFLHLVALKAPHFSQKTIPLMDILECVLWIIVFLIWITCQEGTRHTCWESSNGKGLQLDTSQFLKLLDLAVQTPKQSIQRYSPCDTDKLCGVDCKISLSVGLTGRGHGTFFSYFFFSTRLMMIRTNQR